MIFNMTVSGGSGSGGTLVVTAPAGVIVTAVNETFGKIYKRTVNAEGIATFEGLTSGIWELSITDGERTSIPVAIEITADYEITLAFFAAHINVTYPEGSVCTCTDGKSTFTAPDTTGTWAFTIPYKGTWTLNVTDGNQTDTTEVQITTDGQKETVTLAYFKAYINVTYPEGSTCTCTNESAGVVLTDDGTTGQVVFSIPSTGTWTVSCTDGTNTKSETVNITTEGQSVSVELSYRLYLYKNGNQLVGWTNQQYCTFEGDHILMGASAYPAWCYVTEPQDFAKYDKMGVLFEIPETAGTYGVAFGVCSSAPTANPDPYGSAPKNPMPVYVGSNSIGSQTLYCDISNVSTGYVTLFASYDCYNVKVKEVWLENEAVLFNNGMVSDLAGAFVGNTNHNTNYGDANYTVDESLKVSANSGYDGGSWAVISSENGIDISGFSLIQFNIKSTSADTNGSTTFYRRVGLSTSVKNSTFTRYVDIDKTGLVSINISDLEGVYYPTIYTYAYSGSGTGYIGEATLNVDKIILS